MENTITITREQYTAFVENDIKVRLLLRKYDNRHYSLDMEEAVRDLWDLEDKA